MSDRLKAELARLQKKHQTLTKNIQKPIKIQKKKKSQPLQIEENQTAYSNIAPLPEGKRDFAVTILKDCAYELKESIPTVDPFYILPAETTYWTMYALEHNKIGLITGPPGTGKTALVRQCCALTNRPYIRINGMAGLDPSDQIGMLQLNKDETYYSYGDVALAVKYGACLAYDEPWKNSAGTNMCFMNIMEKEQPKLLLYGHPEYEKRHLKPHADFRLILCDNVCGVGDNIDKYVATERQDDALLNRVNLHMYLSYLSPTLEAELLQKRFPQLDEQTRTRMILFGNSLRDAWQSEQIEQPFSPRNLIEWAEAFLFSKDLTTSFQHTYSFLGTSEVVQTLIKNLWTDAGLAWTDSNEIMWDVENSNEES